VLPVDFAEVAAAVAVFGFDVPDVCG